MSFDFMQGCARQKHSLPADWFAYEFNAEIEGVLIVTGAVCPTVTRGKNKGQPNFKKRDRSTERRVALTPDELDAFKLAWERDNDKCHRCHGSGEVMKSWHHIDGITMRPCKRCGGTGRQPSDCQTSRTEGK